jgi:hypothetical protein
MNRRVGWAGLLSWVLSVGCGATEPVDEGPVLSADTGVDSPSSDAGPASGVGVNAGATKLIGTLGALGPIQPIVSSKVISNSGETLIYMTTAPLTCEELMVSRWLGAFAQGAQVVEIVVSGPAKLGPAKSPEVNYAAGGKSSSYEKGAKTSGVTFTKSEPMGVVEGTVMATYATGELTGNFHAEFCPDGQGY